jgi:hypothetical protein
MQGHRERRRQGRCCALICLTRTVIQKAAEVLRVGRRERQVKVACRAEGRPRLRRVDAVVIY